MIVSVDELKVLPEFDGIDDEILIRKLNAVEKLIRAHTNNNFQNRSVRFEAKSEGNCLFGSSPFLKIGDTVQISKSRVNDGLYKIIEISVNNAKVDMDLFSVPYNLVTKIEYPDDVKEGVINLLSWEIENRKKVGVNSESISRHSVTYFDLDASNQVMGYPVSLLGFLTPYKKARF